MKKLILFAIILSSIAGCKKSSGGSGGGTTTPPSDFSLSSAQVGTATLNTDAHDVPVRPLIALHFSAPVNRSSAASAITLLQSGSSIGSNLSFAQSDSTVLIQPTQALAYLTRYSLTATISLKSTSGGSLRSNYTYNFMTSMDSSDKFPIISDTDLVEKAQRQTFAYFWDGAHPVSRLARERNTSGDVVTTGGSGFGIMALIVAIHRNFITRSEGLARLQTMVGFLKNTAQKFHGAFPHWLNGQTGAVIPFSTKDDGADLVETAYLMQGLLCARQYFNGADATETSLRNDINTLWQNVEWSWFRKNSENVLYWHWSPNYAWDMNVQIRGWNEALITYVLAASSPGFSIPRIVYDNGWAQNGGIRNGNSYYGYTLPLGEPGGGPLFFSHYSFLGINPNGLNDAYANYTTQVTNHTLMNLSYVTSNPKGYYGYSDQCWGLTASDIPGGYAASSPTHDLGVIAPTAALSSFPYTPAASMKALRFFYYKLGDKLWGAYGFHDAFSLHDAWFADSYLAIDQGPIIVMIENYRSGLLWNLFTSCPEVKTGMRNLGFTAPYLN